MQLTVIEPSWDGLAHCPVNLGTLRVLQAAYPHAELCLATSDWHFQELSRIDGAQQIARLNRLNFVPGLDTDSMPADQWRTARKFWGPVWQRCQQSDLMFLTSCTASVLNFVTWSGLAKRCVTVLHGNANDLTGWRSRHPIRRALDFQASMRRYCHAGGKVLVYEEGIQERLGARHAWLAPALFKWGHPLLDDEASGVHRLSQDKKSIRIGFAGSATIAKGFPEFVRLANIMNKAKPGVFSFHAFSYLHPQCQGVDQSALDTKAHRGLPRSRFLEGLASLDLIFAWHADQYYANAASGIMYDAINLGIPMLARRTERMSYLESKGMPIGLAFSELEELANYLILADAELLDLTRYRDGLAQARQLNSTPRLAQDLRNILRLD